MPHAPSTRRAEPAVHVLLLPGRLSGRVLEGALALQRLDVDRARTRPVHEAAERLPQAQPQLPSGRRLLLEAGPRLLRRRPRRAGALEVPGRGRLRGADRPPPLAPDGAVPRAADGPPGGGARRAPRRRAHRPRARARRARGRARRAPGAVAERNHERRVRPRHRLLRARATASARRGPRVAPAGRRVRRAARAVRDRLRREPDRARGRGRVEPRGPLHLLRHFRAQRHARAVGGSLQPLAALERRGEGRVVLRRHRDDAYTLWPVDPG
mmetsp:Transcript_14982/g.44750  ORF Transcript_14982/g.44750 Transcript_14982/m.44750 type:complete len:269 (+) Transcript_14982:488-1294(+)